MKAAVAVRRKAYAPYSHYSVGAALWTADQRIFVGCNVENASYGLTICAERSAATAMIASGAQEPQACVVITAGPRAGSPCGACRQVLFELTEDMPVRMLAVDEHEQVVDTQERSLVELLPLGFRLRPGSTR